MLGLRGVRLGVMMPNVNRMQVRAILEAAADCIGRGLDVQPKIMVPQVCTHEELRLVRKAVDEIHKEVEAKSGHPVNFLFGTMIEVVRACMRADSLAGDADFDAIVTGANSVAAMQPLLDWIDAEGVDASAIAGATVFTTGFHNEIPTGALLLVLLVLCALDVAAQGVTLPEARRVELENGTVLLLNEKHDVPLIGLQATIRGGAISDPDDKAGLASLVAGLLEKGAGDRNAAAFAEAVDSVGGTLTASAGLETVTVAAEFLARDADLMVELVTDMLRSPRFDATETRKLRDRRIGDRARRCAGQSAGGGAPAAVALPLPGHHRVQR